MIQLNLSRETRFLGANGGGEKNILPVQLTTRRICNHTVLIDAQNADHVMHTYENLVRGSCDKTFSLEHRLLKQKLCVIFNRVSCIGSKV